MKPGLLLLLPLLLLAASCTAPQKRQAPQSIIGSLDSIQGGRHGGDSAARTPWEKAKPAERTAPPEETEREEAEPSETRGNEREESFSEAKRTALSRVFYDHRVTLYCRATFDMRKNVTLPQGFRTSAHKSRLDRIEWEHIVPAENFGRSFAAWREGAPVCRNAKGSFRGRKCATAASRTYRLMQADLYNLYPAIGAVNAARNNFNFEELGGGAASSFGSCPMKISRRRVEPPEYAKGLIARTYLYMESAYPVYRMSYRQRALMKAWDRSHPADAWECLRAKRIRAIQGNANPFTEKACARR